MGKGGENKGGQPTRKISLDELSQHRTPDNGILFYYFFYILYIIYLSLLLYIISMVNI
jgi:hypothetical protein